MTNGKGILCLLFVALLLNAIVTNALSSMQPRLLGSESSSSDDESSGEAMTPSPTLMPTEDSDSSSDSGETSALVSSSNVLNVEETTIIHYIIVFILGMVTCCLLRIIRDKICTKNSNKNVKYGKINSTDATSCTSTDEINISIPN